MEYVFPMQLSKNDDGVVQKVENYNDNSGFPCHMHTHI